MKSDYVILAIRNLRRRGIRSWLTLLGIVIGIIAVVSLISVGDGLRLAVTSQFGVESTEIITVQAGGISGYGPPGSGVVKPLTTDDETALEKVNNVKFAIGRIVKSVQTEFNSKSQIGFATNVPSGVKRDYFYETQDFNLIAGRLLQESDINKVVLGNDFSVSEKSGYEKAIEVGDSISLNGKDFRVVGILKKKGSFIWDKIFLINEKELKDLTGVEKNLDIIAVRVKDKNLINKTSGDIEQLMRKRRDVKLGQEDFEVSTPAAALATVNSILGGVQAFIVLIALISIFVGAIGIVNTMTTSVMERVKEIGIMKAIGAKNSDIFFQFFIEAGLLGFVGGVIGVLVGTGLGFLGIQGINSFIGASTPFNLNIFLIVGTLFGSFLIGSVSGISPAMMAAKLNPVEALRK
jgi:putative ABC transport system permease protein